MGSRWEHRHTIPRALLSVWLYGLMTGIRSSRKLEAACRDQIPYLWLTGWQHPDHNTLWRFYKEHRQAMRSLLKRTVRTAVAMELVDLAVQAVDGTRVAASATWDRTYDAGKLGKLFERVEKAIVDLEAQNEAGEETAATHLPMELADKEVLRERVRRAMDDLASQEGLKQINLTDQDARMMKTRHGIVPGYNAQAVVSPVEPDEEAARVLITAIDLVNEPTDYTRLIPMLQRAEEMTGVKAPLTLADAGYHSAAALEGCFERGQQVVMPEPSRGRALDHPYHKDRFTYDPDSDTYKCPQGKLLRRSAFMRRDRAYQYVAHQEDCQSCPVKTRCLPSNQKRRYVALSMYYPLLLRVRERNQSAEYRERRRRKTIAEGTFASLDRLGWARSRLRGLWKVDCEGYLAGLAHNVLKAVRRLRGHAGPTGPLEPGAVDPVPPVSGGDILVHVGG